VSSGTRAAAIHVQRSPWDSDPAELERIRQDFPILQRQVHGKPLVYLDNAATTQKPQSVIDAISRYYSLDNANVHRGVHYLSQAATEAYDTVRQKTGRFLNARFASEVIFTRGTTDGINLVAQSYGRRLVPGDEILITEMEHHSNIIPWQLVAQQTGAVLRAAPMTDSGEIDLKEFEQLLGKQTRFVSLVHLSNALGTVNPVKEMIGLAHERGIPVLIDGAQSVPHLGVDVQDLDCDFLVFSGHKLYGPTGVGVLYGKESLLEKMPPYQGGGGMIDTVSIERSTWAPVPQKFEAGTPMIAEVIGLGAALDYVQFLGLPSIAEWEHQLLTYATQELQQIPGLTLIGSASERASVLSFVLEGIHPHDVGTVLDQAGIAIRAGHHCAQPTMQHFRLPGTARASFGLYNTMLEVDQLAAAVRGVAEMFV
jgi:cysteine desulfurase / selenocysteine lyase